MFTKVSCLLNTVILKGASHYFFKKEYQARGAPHNHVELWIDSAPTIGRDKSGKIRIAVDARENHMPNPR